MGLRSRLRRLFYPPQPPPVEREEVRLCKMLGVKKRFIEESVTMRGHTFVIPDAPSFAHQINEIFIDQVYKATFRRPDPLIFDCGSNVGLSIFYFKENYPAAQVIGFEADHQIFGHLFHNVGGLPGVTLHEAAVWIAPGELTFHAQGADGGSLQNKFAIAHKVKSLRLRDLLAQHETVDLLKMDIEGAETEVLRDCEDVLPRIDKLFVEYHSLCGAPQELDVILSLLSRSGFRYYLEGMEKKSSPFENKRTNVNMDLQVSIWAQKGQMT